MVEEGAHSSVKDSIRKSSHTDEGATLNIGIVEINPTAQSSSTNNFNDSLNKEPTPIVHE